MKLCTASVHHTTRGWAKEGSGTLMFSCLPVSLPLITCASVPWDISKDIMDTKRKPVWGEDTRKTPQYLNAYACGNPAVFCLRVGHRVKDILPQHNTHNLKSLGSVDKQTCFALLTHTVLKLTYVNIIYLHLCRDESISSVLHLAGLLQFCIQATNTCKAGMYMEAWIYTKCLTPREGQRDPHNCSASPVLLYLFPNTPSCTTSNLTLSSSSLPLLVLSELTSRDLGLLVN